MTTMVGVMTVKKALITVITGQIGIHLSEFPSISQISQKEGVHIFKLNLVF